MSLSAKIRKAVDTAFSAVGDLAKPGTLSSTEVSSYDFASGDVVSTNSEITVDVIITTTEARDGSLLTQALMKSGEDLSGYDTLTVSGVTYQIILPYTDDGFLISANIVRSQ